MGAKRRRKWDINGAHDASDVGHNDGIPEIWTSFLACDLRILKTKLGLTQIMTKWGPKWGINGEYIGSTWVP